MLRGAVAVTAAAALALSGAAGSTSRLAAPVSVGAGDLLFSGHGWGHGVGMSQWGTLGYAERGWLYDAILAHYYPGTTLGPAPVAKLRVLLVENAAKVVLSSDQPWKVRDADGEVQALEPGKLTLRPGLKVRFPTSAQPTQLSQPVTFLPGKAPLQVNGKPFRGTLDVTVAKAKLQVVNVVPLEGYLKGVVPSEMPSGWPAEALKTQAVAARSYALANRTTTGQFDVYADVRSQVYLGMSNESPAASAAVDATKGQVLLFGGKVADALFFSSSGGRTAAPAEVFAGTKFPPYLVPVADPYDTASPNHDWGPLPVDVNAAGKKLGLKGRLTDLRLEPWPSGRVKTATALGLAASGLETEVTVTGAQLRSLLGLRSTWLTAGLAVLERPYGPVTYGNAVRITGHARAVGDVTLEQRTGTPLWQPGPMVAPDAGGEFTFTIKPTASTELRLVAGTLRAPGLKVPVAPLVRLTAPKATAILPTSLRGTTRPVIAGGTVQIQRLEGTAWTDVADAPVDARGSFAVTLDVQPGAYRARYAPGNGLVAGLSPQIQVGP